LATEAARLNRRKYTARKKKNRLDYPGFSWPAFTTSPFAGSVWLAWGPGRHDRKIGVTLFSVPQVEQNFETVHGARAGKLTARLYPC